MKTFAIGHFALAGLSTLVAAQDGDRTSDLGGPVWTTGYPPSVTPSASSQTGCPTVTATRELCATCAIPLCLGLVTVTQSCGCPTPMATVFLDFPCSEGCRGVFCSTSYATVTASSCSSGGSGLGPGGAAPTPAPNGTVSTGPPRSSSTSSIVQANAAGRMALPRLGWW